MDYEVELKYRVDDPERIIKMLTECGAVPHEVQQHWDAYFNHPARDFAQTDEAFRIRSIGEQNRLTYKGPLVDKLSKTRQEIEVDCEAGADGLKKLHAMLPALGFREVRTVVKQRTPFHLDWQGQCVEVTLDQVEGLGHFVELETMADENHWESARDALLQLAEALELHNSERRSYLQLLLGK